MTRDEAQELFSAAYDGELAPEQRTAFDAVLAGDAELRAEFAEFRALLDEAHRLEDAPDLEVPDLLPNVQKKLRARSRGRFYRDRFATTGMRGALWPLLLALAMLLVIGVTWFGLTYIDVQDTVNGDGD